MTTFVLTKRTTVYQRYLQKKFSRVRVESSDDEEGKEKGEGDDREALARELFDSEDEDDLPREQVSYVWEKFN